MQTENTEQNGNTDSPVAQMVNTDLQENLTTPGGVLRAERLRQNLSEKEVSEYLHLTMHYVRAIESNRFDKLPGAVFAKGYIKSYALMLGLDANIVAALFDGINTEQQEMKDEATQRHLARRRRDRNKPWVYASVVCFVLGFAGLWAYNIYSTNLDAPGQGASQTPPPTPSTIASRPIAQSPAPELVEENSTVAQIALQSGAPGLAPVVPQQIPSTASPPEATPTSLRSAVDSLIPIGQVTNEPGLATVDQAAPANAAPTPARTNANVIAVRSEGNDVLRINFSGESWVEVNDSRSNQIYRDILEAGDVLEITGDAPFSILLGDAPFTRMFLNGNEINVSDNIRIDNSARLTVGL